MQEEGSVWTWSLNATGMKGKGGSVVCVRGRRGVREGSEEWRGAGWSGQPTTIHPRLVV
jgi:hypothetical protein